MGANQTREVEWVSSRGHHLEWRRDHQGPKGGHLTIDPFRARSEAELSKGDD